MQRYRLNVKLLIVLIAAGIVTVVGVYFVWSAQVSRNAGSHLVRAREAREVEDLEEAIKLYNAYLKFVPTDGEAQAEFALTAIEKASRLDAVPEDYGLVLAILPESILKIPENDEVRQKYVEFAMRIRRFQVALQHLDVLIDQHPDRAEFKVKKLRCLRKTGAIDGDQGAITYGYQLIGYDRATNQFDPDTATAGDQPMAYALLANVIRDHHQDRNHAREILDQMVVDNPDNYESHLIRGRFLNRSEKTLEESRVDIEKAFELSPEDPNVLLEMIRLALSDEDTERARQLLDDGIRTSPTIPTFYIQYAHVEAIEKNLEGALDMINQGIVAVPRPQILLFKKVRYQVALHDVAGIRKTKEQMANMGLPTPFLQFVDGTALMTEGKWTAAADKFRSARPLLGSSSQTVFQAVLGQCDLYLGNCYQHLGMWDLARQSFELAAELNPDNKALIGFADQMRRRLGLDVRVGLDTRGGGGALNDFILAEKAKPEGKRDWAKVDEAVEEMIEQNSLDETSSDILRAEVLLYRDKYEKARECVQKITEGEVDDIRSWLGAMNLSLRDPEHGPKDALAILEKAVDKFGDMPPLRLRKLAYLAMLGGEDLPEKLAQLTDGIDGWKASDQVKIWTSLADAYLRLREFDRIEECREKILALAPEDLATRVQIFAVARARTDNGQMKSAQDEILKVVGRKSHPTYRYSEAARLITQFHTGKIDKSELKKATELVNAALKDRPQWHRLHILKAELNLARGRRSRAIDDYDRALELGPPDPYSVIRHAQLLVNFERFRDARRVVDKLSKPVRQQWLGQLNAEIMLRTDNLPEALETYEKLISKKPESESLRLQYGQMLVRASEKGEKVARLAKAEEMLRKSVELGPNVFVTWNAWISFLAKSNRIAEAEEAVRKAQLALPTDSLPYVMAHCSQMLGHWHDAEGFYRTAINADPTNFRLVRRLAEFYLSRSYPRRDGIAKATPLVNKILRAAENEEIPKDGEDTLWARRVTAKVFASTKAYQQLLKAEKLLEANSIDGDLRIEDKLLLASILAPRPEPESRNKAIALLEECKAAGDAINSTAALSLATLYQQVNNWPKARSQMHEAISRFGDNPDVWQTFVQMLVARGDFARAGDQLRRLVELRPNSSKTLELRVRVLAGQGKKKKAVALLHGLLPKSRKAYTEEHLRLLRNVAQLLTETDAIEAAGQVYRLHFVLSKEFDEKEAAENDGKSTHARSAKSMVLFARFLGHHGDAEEAFKLMQAMWAQTKSTQIIKIALSVIRNRRDELGDRYDEIIDRWIISALRTSPDSMSIQMQLADFRDAQKKYAETEDIYRQLLRRGELDGGLRGLVLNNLAFLLAIQKKDLSDASDFVNEAARLFGPTVDMLDTMGVVKIAMKDGRGAVSDLELSLSDRPTASKQFHLAQAYLLIGDNRHALQAWNDGIDLDLDLDAINRLEHNTYRDVERKIESIRAGAD